MDFTFIDFFIYEHWFQFFFFILTTFTFIGFILFHLFWTAYPDIILSKLSLLKFLGIGLSKTKASNKHLDKGVEKIEQLEEKYDEIVHKIYSKTFYPFFIFFGLNILLGYATYFSLFYIYDSHESSFLINLGIIIVSYIFTKIIKKGL